MVSRKPLPLATVASALIQVAVLLSLPATEREEWPPPPAPTMEFELVVVPTPEPDSRAAPSTPAERKRAATSPQAHPHARRRSSPRPVLKRSPRADAPTPPPKAPLPAPHIPGPSTLELDSSPETAPSLDPDVLQPAQVAAAHLQPNRLPIPSDSVEYEFERAQRIRIGGHAQLSGIAILAMAALLSCSPSNRQAAYRLHRPRGRLRK